MTKQTSIPSRRSRLPFVTSVSVLQRPVAATALIMWLIGTLAGTSAHASLIAEFTFDNNIGNRIPDVATGILPNPDIGKKANGASFASANTFGVSSIGTLLGQSGLMQEPVEPTSQTNQYGFWTDKSLLQGRSEWTLLMWINQREGGDDDFLFYVGTGDGFRGTGSETYMYIRPDGHIAVHDISGSTYVGDLFGDFVTPGVWHQVGLTRSGSTAMLYLDGEIMDTDTSVSMDSFDKSGNSVIVFGAAKWMRNANHRLRVHDGLLDQIEVYDQALGQAAIKERYDAFAVPEPASVIVWCQLAVFGVAVSCRRKRRTRVA